MANKSTISLIASGKPYSQFKTARISKSLDAIGGSCEFTLANDQISDFPIHAQDDIVVKINGEDVIAGLINRIEPSYSASGANVTHELRMSGFDYTYSAVQAGVFANAQYTSPITIKTLLEKILRDNGVKNVKVTNNSGRPSAALIIPESIKISAETGDTLFSFMDKYAKMLNLLLGADSKGGITIDEATNQADFRFSGITLRNKIGDRKNARIFAASSVRDYSNRFDAVLVISQNKGGGVGNKGSDVRGLKHDIGVRKEGAKVIVSDVELDQSGAAAVAAWEVRKRRADSIVYTAAVQGFSADGKEIWKPGMIVDIDDDYAGVNSRMKLRSVDFNLGSGGSFTSLSFVPPDAYDREDINTIISDYDEIGDSNSFLSEKLGTS